MVHQIVLSGLQDQLTQPVIVPQAMGKLTSAKNGHMMDGALHTTHQVFMDI